MGYDKHTQRRSVLPGDAETPSDSAKLAAWLGAMRNGSAQHLRFVRNVGAQTVAF